MRSTLASAVLAIGIACGGGARATATVQVLATQPSGGILTLAIGLIGFAGSAWGLWRWRGLWRLAAAVPAAIMVFVALRIIIDTSFDPASHNPWPFEILMWGFVSTASIAVMMLARRRS